ncbi:MAG: GNAT family N-acetyltransferase [Caldilineaceae bacterium]
MATISLHHATAEDVPALLSIIRAAFEQYRGRLDPPSGAHSEDESSIRAKLTGETAVLAWEEGKPVAAVFYQVCPDHVYLHRLAVLPSHRGRGFGRRLVDYVEAQALILERPRVQLGVRLALPENLDYYQRLGYRILEYASHPGYTEYTYVTMGKDLETRSQTGGSWTRISG